jgi:hypothetical protein
MGRIKKTLFPRSIVVMIGADVKNTKNTRLDIPPEIFNFWEK